MRTLDSARSVKMRAMQIGVSGIRRSYIHEKASFWTLRSAAKILVPNKNCNSKTMIGRIHLILAAFAFSCCGVLAFRAPFTHLPYRRLNLRLFVGATMPVNENNEGVKETRAGVILAGNSPKAIKLRKTLQDIWSSPRQSPVVVIGPKGSGKSTLVEELIERLPASQRVNIHRLPLDDAIDHFDTMVGLTNHPGLLDVLADAANTTVVLTGFQSVSAHSSQDLCRRQELKEIVAGLVMNQTFYSRFERSEKTFKPRIIATYSDYPKFVDSSTDVFMIKVPPLESRIKDMEAIATSKIRIFERSYGLESVRLSAEATHRLLDHRWEVCEPELDEELHSALDLLAKERQKDPEVSNTLKSKHMFVEKSGESMRHRLLYELPVLREIIKSPWVFDHTLRYIVLPAFAFTLAALFLGPQTRDHNAALTYFWAGWWPAVMLSFPFLGRIWCSICPFMAVGNIAQETVTKFGVELKSWPKWGKSIGAAFAFGLFFLILMWEELWNLPQNGTLSASLLLLITSGAVFNSVQYEKRMWCRYLCPIGAMCRVFGTMSMTEVRTWKTNCEGCTSSRCTRGMSPKVDLSDNFALKGCTMNLKSNQLRDMGDVRKVLLPSDHMVCSLSHHSFHHSLLVC